MRCWRMALPSRAVVDSTAGQSRVGRDGVGKERDSGCDGKRSVTEITGEESVGSTVNEAANRRDEGPAHDGINRDFGTESNAEFDGTAVDKGVREVVSDDSTKAAVEGGWVVVGGVGDGTGETDGFKRVEVVVEFDKVGDTVGVDVGQGFVEDIRSAVEAGASV